MGPGPHTGKGSLHLHNAAVHCQQFRPVMIWAPPPDQILDLPLQTHLPQVPPGKITPRWGHLAKTQSPGWVTSWKEDMIPGSSDGRASDA